MIRISFISVCSSQLDSLNRIKIFTKHLTQNNNKYNRVKSFANNIVIFI